MSRYELKLGRKGDQEPQKLQFEADDASMALILAHQRASDRSAELWQDGKKLCTIKRELLGESEAG
jgi:hypothetical protein